LVILQLGNLVISVADLPSAHVPILSTAGVLEGVHHGFFEPYPFKMRLFEATLQYFVDFDA
jgi:hypothetical protein